MSSYFVWFCINSAANRELRNSITCPTQERHWHPCQQTVDNTNVNRICSSCRRREYPTLLCVMCDHLCGQWEKFYSIFTTDSPWTLSSYGPFIQAAQYIKDTTNFVRHGLKEDEAGLVKILPSWGQRVIHLADAVLLEWSHFLSSLPGPRILVAEPRGCTS